MRQKIINYRYYKFFILYILIFCFFEVRADSITCEQNKYNWELMTDNAPWIPRDGAGGIVYDNKMWLLGGWNPDLIEKDTDNGVWNSSNGRTWNLVKPDTFNTPSFNPSQEWEGRHLAGYVSFDGKMWIIGGDPIQGYYQNDIWNSTDGVNWNLVHSGTTLPWKDRALFMTVVFQNKIWVMGGQTVPQLADASEVIYNDIWNSEDGITWNQVTPNGAIWSPRALNGNYTVFKDRIWIVGGGTYDTPDRPYREYYTDVWSSADGISWEKVSEASPWYGTLFPSVATFDNKLWMLGGNHTPGDINDVWFSEDGITWEQLENTPWPRRHAATTFEYNNELYITSGSNFASDVWKLKKCSYTESSGGEKQQLKKYTLQNYYPNCKIIDGISMNYVSSYENAFTDTSNSPQGDIIAKFKNLGLIL